MICPTDDAGWDALALETVRATKAAGRFVPGLGHPVHKVEDPRTPVLIKIATEEGSAGRTCSCSRRSAGSMIKFSAADCR